MDCEMGFCVIENFLVRLYLLNTTPGDIIFICQNEAMGRRERSRKLAVSKKIGINRKFLTFGLFDNL